MKTKDVKVGGIYLAKVSGSVVPVRLDRESQYGGWEGTNLRTRKPVRIKTAARLRCPCNENGGVDRESVMRAYARPKPLTVQQTKEMFAAKDATAEQENPPLPPVRSRGTASPISSNATATSSASAPGKSNSLPSTANGRSSSGAVSQSASPTTTSTPISSHTSAAARSAAPAETPANGQPATALGKVLARTNDGKPKPKHQPTEEQAAVIAAAQGLQGCLVVEAGAGCGKTATLTMLARALPGRGQYTAFNTALVNESKVKFGGTAVECNTTHSLAFRAEGKRFAHRLGGARQRSDQVAAALGLKDLILQTIGSDGKPAEKTLAAGFLAGCVIGAVRRFCQSADREIDGSHFRYLDGLDLPTADGRRGYANNEKVRDYLVPFAWKAWKDLSDPDGQLPFSHDCYVKIWQLGKPVISADYLLVDESQDSSPCFLDIVKQQKCPVILVGDGAQAIYEWRGAVDAMKAYPNAPRRQLSLSFRFGQAIADVANAVLATLEEPTALRLRGLPSIQSRVAPCEAPRAILCRTNAVAVGSLLQALAAGKRPFLVGGGADVIAFVEGAQALQQGRSTSHPDLACFASWTEVQQYVKAEEGEDLKLFVKLIDGFGADAILAALRSMPPEKDADLVVSTAHKAKGREWDSVQLASDFPTQSKCGDPERKLLYVAVTRAKLQLDVSQCPFFTGEDALDLSALRRPDPPTDSIAPPTPAAPPAPQSFSWAKGKQGDWLVRGPAGKSGQEVEVMRKDGSTSRKRLGAVVWEGQGAALYQV